MDFGQISGLPKNSDFMVLNTLMHRYGWDSDGISIILKNTKTGEKIKRFIKDPMMEVGIAKPGSIDTRYSHICTELQNVDFHEIKHANKFAETAKLLGKEEYNSFFNKIKSREAFKAREDIIRNPRVFSIDRNLEDYYRYIAFNHFGEKEYTITKGFLDIEADIAKGSIDFKTGTGDAPVNAVTLIDREEHTSYTLILRDETNDQIPEFEKNIKAFKNGIKEEFDKKFIKLDYKFAFFDDELELLRVLFQVLNQINKDVVLIWNMAFDIRYIIHRIKALGGDPADIMSHPDFSEEERECVYHFGGEFDAGKRTDFFSLSSYTQYVCQMINYASIRSAGPKLDSLKLDDVGKDEVGVQKVDYHDIVSHIKYLPKANFALFIKYNIMDVIVQVMIEDKVRDADTAFYRAYESNTRLNKVFKGVTLLTNVAYKHFRDISGLILGNNVNALLARMVDKKKREKFGGAFIGLPKRLAHAGKLIFRKIKSKNIFDIVLDYDFTSLYPTILAMFNIFKSTMIGKFVLVDEEECNDHISHYFYEECAIESKYDRGAQLVEDMELDEPLFFMKKWCGMPGPYDLIKEFEKQHKEKPKNIKFKKTNKPKPIVRFKKIS